MFCAIPKKNKKIMNVSLHKNFDGLLLSLERSEPHSQTKKMDLWFEISHKTFEIFFERKLELYHGEVSLLDLPEEEEEEKGMEGEEQDDVGEGGKRKNKTKVSALLTEPLKPMPTTFLDSADEATITRYHKLPSGFDVTTDENIKQEDEDENSSLYGELTPEGVRQMCNYFFFSPSNQGGEKEQIQKAVLTAKAELQLSADEKERLQAKVVFAVLRGDSIESAVDTEVVERRSAREVRAALEEEARVQCLDLALGELESLQADALSDVLSGTPVLQAVRACLLPM